MCALLASGTVQSALFDVVRECLGCRVSIRSTAVGKAVVFRASVWRLLDSTINAQADCVSCTANLLCPIEHIVVAVCSNEHSFKPIARLIAGAKCLCLSCEVFSAFMDLAGLSDALEASHCRASHCPDCFNGKEKLVDMMPSSVKGWPIRVVVPIGM